MSFKNKENEDTTIFVVDDDDVDVMGIERALKKLNITNPMLRARDGVEALQMLRTQDLLQQPFIMLLDINMPRKNGIEMLRELRGDPELRRAVVFILTTSNAEEDKKLAYDLNVAGYIVKKNLGSGTMEILKMLQHYWQSVELPMLSKT
ncbi:response regulator [Aurantivibrio infirmus]